MKLEEFATLARHDQIETSIRYELSIIYCAVLGLGDVARISASE